MKIPRTLLLNSGLGTGNLIDKLRIIHKTGTDDFSNLYVHYGLDLFEGRIRNNIENGVVEPTISKIRSIQIATEAAISILRIDDFILSKNNLPFQDKIWFSNKS